MASPTFPNVPFALGVPPVPRAPGARYNDEPRLTKDADEIDRLAASQWGIFFQGRNVLLPDNIVSASATSEYRIADFPIEKGQFESFNKVALPRQNRVVMSKGGSLSERQDFLYRLKSIEGDLRAYDILTPERVYLSANIERVTLDRDAGKGATLLTVEVVLREIRQTATVAFSSSRDPSGADPVNGGFVQTKPTSIPPSSIR